MSESRVRENRMHGSMRRREATTASRASTAVRPREPPADPTMTTMEAGDGGGVARRGSPSARSGSPRVGRSTGRRLPPAPGPEPARGLALPAGGRSAPALLRRDLVALRVGGLLERGDRDL